MALISAIISLAVGDNSISSSSEISLLPGTKVPLLSDWLSFIVAIDISKFVELEVFPDIFQSPNPSEVRDAGLNAKLEFRGGPDDRVLER